MFAGWSEGSCSPSRPPGPAAAPGHRSGRKARRTSRSPGGATKPPGEVRTQAALPGALGGARPVSRKPVVFTMKAPTSAQCQKSIQSRRGDRAPFLSLFYKKSESVVTCRAGVEQGPGPAGRVAAVGALHLEVGKHVTTTPFLTRARLHHGETGPSALPVSPARVLRPPRWRGCHCTASAGHSTETTGLELVGVISQSDEMTNFCSQ